MTYSLLNFDECYFGTFPDPCWGGGVVGVCRGPTENDSCPVSELPGPPGHAQAGQVCWYVREDAQFKVDPSYQVNGF